MTSNRIATYMQSLDHLLASVSSRALAEEGLLAGSPFTSEAPLEIFLERKALRVVVERSIKQMSKITNKPDLSGEIKAQLEAEVARRKAFLEWLSQEQLPLYVGLFPKSEFNGSPDPEPVTREDE